MSTHNIGFYEDLTKIIFELSSNMPGAQFESDFGEILALGAEILPYIGLREKWESP